MNIRYLQSNFLKLPEDNLVKFLYNIIMQDVKDVENYQEGLIYNKGDRVYLQENGKHQIFQCLVDTSSSVFIDTEWAYILEIYEGKVDKVYNLDLKEEVHYIEEYNRSEIYTNLDFNKQQSTVAVYCGKKRYVKNHDFIIEGNKITFMKPFDIGDRLILEVRECVGTLPEMVYIVLYDLNSKPYKVGLNYAGEITIEECEEISDNDIRYGELVTGDRTYTLLVDGGSKPYELKAYRKIETYITGTNDEIYKVEAIGDELKLIDCSHDRTAYSDTKYILGLDNNFYSLSVKNNKIVATRELNSGLETRNVDFGVRLINDKFESRVVCIDDGTIKLLPYIDNGGYRYINLIDIETKELYRVSVTEDDTLELNEGLAEDGYSGTRLLEYFYFFDEQMSYNRLFVKQGLLYYEDSELNVIPDSKGINMLREDGEMVKLRFPYNGEGIHVIKCISLDNLGTFESPIEGFVVDIDNVTKLITVNKDGTGFEIIDTDLPFRTNHHYILSQDDEIYKLIFDNGFIDFVKGVNSEIETITYINADGIYYYLEENDDGEVDILMTDTLPENAVLGVLTTVYNGVKYRLVSIDGEPTFIKTEESFTNENSYVSCVNNPDRACYFALANGEFFINLFNNRKFDTIDDYEIECLTVGAYIKSHERITRFDIINGELILHPISTFRHRIKAADGNTYVVDVTGEPYEEVLTFTDIRDTEYNNNLGSGSFYLEGTNGTRFIADIDDMGRINFKEGEASSYIDYNITSLVQSSQGLYKIIIDDENIRLEKMFDNMYETDVLSYGNLVKKGLNVQLNNGTWYTFAANGLGEVVIKEIDKVDATGLLLRSDDGYNYGLGMLSGQFITYKSYVSNPIVQEKLYIKDSVTGIQHALFMKGSRLCSEPVEGNNNATDFLIMNDAYRNEFKIEINNNVLMVSTL